MFSFTKWFTKANDDDYENVLAAIALDIQKRQTRLSEIRGRERRATFLVTMYTLALWVAYLSMWYLGALPRAFGHQQRRSELQRTLAAAPVIVGPIVILFIRRIVQIWYTRIGDAEEKTLNTLIKQQRSKVEEVKKKTNYYSTRNLIERYDDPSNRQMSPGHVRPPVPSTPPRIPITPNANLSPPTAMMTPNLLPPGMMAMQALQPPTKQWYDRLMDVVVGESEHETSAPTSRYALICEKCLVHNGLVKESMWEDAQYVCPKCGHFNASARSNRKSTPPASPDSAASTPAEEKRPRTPADAPNQTEERAR